jgi:hypothetical protein
VIITNFTFYSMIMIIMFMISMIIIIIITIILMMAGAAHQLPLSGGDAHDEL